MHLFILGFKGHRLAFQKPEKPFLQKPAAVGVDTYLSDSGAEQVVGDTKAVCCNTFPPSQGAAPPSKSHRGSSSTLVTPAQARRQHCKREETPESLPSLIRSALSSTYTPYVERFVVTLSAKTKDQRRAFGGGTGVREQVSFSDQLNSNILVTEVWDYSNTKKNTGH